MAGFNSRQGFVSCLWMAARVVGTQQPKTSPGAPTIRERGSPPTCPRHTNHKATPMHPRTLHRLHQRLSAPHRLARLIRDFLDAEPDHTHALAILNDLTAIRTFIAASIVTMGLAHGGSIGMERMAREVDAACRSGHARGLRGVGGTVRRVMSREGK